MKEIRIYLVLLMIAAICDRWVNWYHSPLRWLTSAILVLAWCAIWIATPMHQKPPRHISRLERQVYDAIPGKTVEERSAAVHEMLDRMNRDGLDDRRATEMDT